jgi:hypothetical protein
MRSTDAMVSSQNPLLRHRRIARPPAAPTKNVGNFIEFAESGEHIRNGQWGVSITGVFLSLN